MGAEVKTIKIQADVPAHFNELFEKYQDAHRLNWRRWAKIPDDDKRWRPGYNKPSKAALFVYMAEIGRKAFEQEIESLLK